MAEERVQRRLAAILAADVAGYSRLMGEDEEGTLAALTAHRTELIEPCIAEHRGRVVKTTGNGLLAEFASVVECRALCRRWPAPLRHGRARRHSRCCRRALGSSSISRPSTCGSGSQALWFRRVG